MNEVVAALNKFKVSVSRELGEYAAHIKGINDHMKRSNGALQECVRSSGDHETRLALVEKLQSSEMDQWGERQQDCKNHIDRTTKLEQRLTLVFIASPIFSLAGGAIVKFMEVKGWL